MEMRPEETARPLESISSNNNHGQNNTQMSQPPLDPMFVGPQQPTTTTDSTRMTETAESVLANENTNGDAVATMSGAMPVLHARAAEPLRQPSPLVSLPVLNTSMEQQPPSTSEYGTTATSSMPTTTTTEIRAVDPAASPHTGLNDGAARELATEAPIVPTNRPFSPIATEQSLAAAGHDRAEDWSAATIPNNAFASAQVPTSSHQDATTGTAMDVCDSPSKPTSPHAMMNNNNAATATRTMQTVDYAALRRTAQEQHQQTMNRHFPEEPPRRQPQLGVQPPQQQAQQQPLDPNGWRELRVEDALNYLDHVKMEFKDRPKIYNQFLAIMKNFKSQEVDTPGVIRRVSTLFRGYNHLILGFNTFLPEGFKIRLADLERHEEAHHDPRAAAWEEQPQQHATNNVGVRPAKKQRTNERAAQRLDAPEYNPDDRGADAAVPPRAEYRALQTSTTASPPPHAWENAYPHNLERPQPPQLSPKKPSPTKPPAARPSLGPSPGQQPPPQQQHQAVEFDHAISYVTTIKRRFANDPGTYHTFLEILHTYQKEQRGIKEVLEQVAHLFQDHPDLLKEFTFFLPDAVQEQAKERLHRAAAESESRQAMQRHQGGSPKFIDMTGANQGSSIDPPQQLQQQRGHNKRLLDVHVNNSSLHPESFVYNSAVERQFFDAAREALTSLSRDGGQAWAEFVKCLDMYAQDILSRNEMLNFVEPLLGKRNTKLFEEFQRILNAAGSPAHPLPFLEDSWHSVPLSEIDFSRCRRCSPSYRALPRDYPAPPCSDRSEEEIRVLNDIWVSLPVGSEESYTFRHMRRNTFEEILFRVEDERFEIDMTIDSNAAALHRLEPIAEEIAQLAMDAPVPTEHGAKGVEGTGLGGQRFQYTFDKTVFGIIHRNAIVRIYGDAGQEMFDLLSKNPTVAIPLVVDRLRQKDKEWRKVRDRLNIHWKQLAQLNYYKSLDHRSLTWRATDKRTTSAKTLISEIKDRSLNGGIEGPEAIKQKLDKMKEEHGTFYEVTMGEMLYKNLDLTFLPKADRRLFTPHLSLVYEQNSWAQRDAYRILAFALERGHISPADKERCHRLWIDFLGPFFGLSLNWMQSPAVAYQEANAGATSVVKLINASVVSEDDEDMSLQEDAGRGTNVVTEELCQRVSSTDSKDDVLTDHHPLPPGAHVSTLYGEGKVIEFRKSDNIYVVQLAFGSKGYLRPATVLCSILPVEKSAYTRELCTSDLSKLARPGDQLAIGTQSLYVFFRLHQILIRRLNIAKRLAFSVGDDQSLKTLVEQMPNSNRNAVGRRRYEAYLSLVYGLLDNNGSNGATEVGKYEDRVRSLLGHGAYELATMDKLISHMWKNIQTMAGDETMWNLVQLYRRHMSAGGFQPEAFRQEAAYQSEGELMYAFQYCPMPGQDKAVMHMEYLGIMSDDGDGDSLSDEKDEVEPVALAEPESKRPARWIAGNAVTGRQ